ncbi:hypothetical protein Fcan01_16648 [Folsomia candida]|uniref:Uncharacterized protein n=1 Tax=Folsomia candida TaxID=158441 RepID=A0A226DV16_FOLCA|nr:hypothetical protein Fcan01_16648 [Folsomia candida]
MSTFFPNILATRSSAGVESLKIFVACLPCTISPFLFELKPAVREPSTPLESWWKQYNNNFQGMRIGSGGGRKFDPGKQTCSAFRRGDYKFAMYETCVRLSLGGKLNFSDILVTGGIRDRFSHTPYDYTFIIYYSDPLEKLTIEKRILYPASAERSWLPHGGYRHQFKMATVSFKKPTLDGLQALFLPLDRYTWAASGLSFTLIAILLTQNALKSGSEKILKGIEYFIQSWQWILSSLSGQYHGASAILPLVSNFPAFVVICVFSFFILGTVFYQGSLFSSLVARIPPSLPVTMEYVVYSKIPIITTSMIYIGPGEPVSFLKYDMLDHVINTSVDFPKLFSTLTYLKA